MPPIHSSHKVGGNKGSAAAVIPQSILRMRLGGATKISLQAVLVKSIDSPIHTSDEIEGQKHQFLNPCFVRGWWGNEDLAARVRALNIKVKPPERVLPGNNHLKLRG